MTRAEKTVLIVLLGEFLILVIIGFFITEFLKSHCEFILLFILLIIILTMLIWHIILGVQKVDDDVKKVRNKKIRFWISGILLFGIIVLFIFTLLFPSINEKFQSCFLLEDLCKQDLFEETDADSSTSVTEEYFSENCIKNTWGYFSVYDDILEEDECLNINSLDISGNNDGFTAVSSGVVDSIFLLIQEIDEDVEKIVFDFSVNELVAVNDSLSEKVFSTDLYFGFAESDPNKLYKSETISSDRHEFDGEYISFCGASDFSTYGFIHQFQNYFPQFDKEENDPSFYQNYVFEITILVKSDNSWDVKIIKLPEKELLFIRTGLPLLSRNFTFGFSIPQGGKMNIEVDNFSIE